MLSFARVKALAIVAVLVAVAAVVVYQALSRDQQVDASQVTGCPAGFVPVDLTLYHASEIKLNVYNGTGVAGVSGQVGEHFANREFDVLKRDDGTGTALDDADVAVVRFGPATVGAAHVVRAYFLYQAIAEFQIDREDDVVDVVIGPGFRQLATETEVRQAIAGQGSPREPAGTCAGEVPRPTPSPGPDAD